MQQDQSCPDTQIEIPASTEPSKAVQAPPVPAAQKIEIPAQGPSLWVRFNPWLCNANGWIAIFTALLLVVAYFQLNASQRATDIANEALRISERTMELAQRAYVSVQRLESRFGHNGVFLYLQNTGVIPADNIRIHIAVSRIETKTLKTIHSHSFDLDLGHNYISKDSPYPIPIRLEEFHQSEIPRIMSGEERLLVGGNVKYTDGVLPHEQTINFAYYFYPFGTDGIWWAAPVKNFAELQGS